MARLAAHLHTGDQAMNTMLRFPGLPAMALALGCLGLPGGAVAGAPMSRPQPAAPGQWPQLVAEQEADERADLPPGAKVSRDQASSIALKTVPGEVTSVDVERKLGKIVYTVEIMTPAGDETDVFVDIETGEVLGTE